MARTEVIQTPPPDVGETRQRPVVPDPVARAIATTEDGAPKVNARDEVMQNATPQPRALADVETFHTRSPASAKKVSQPAASDRALEIHTVGSERRVAAARAQAPMVGEVKAEPPVAPVISIGKIEVQFLPQESRARAQRPPPERTRGFAAYARARRGEPR